MNPALAISLATAAALTGQRLAWLSTGGTLAAAVVGAMVLAGRGLPGGILLLTFFVSGSVLSRLSRRRTLDRAESRAVRTASQVVANGGWAALAAIVPVGYGGWALFAGALSAAQADTWSTEIGAFSRFPPRMLTNGKVADRGTSGAVTILGTAGGIAGGILMGALAWLFTQSMTLGVAVTAGGSFGMITDSWLGATFQGAYYCERCKKPTETRVHACGAVPHLTQGVRWLDNDGVNLAATAVGATSTLAVWLLI